MEEIVPRWEWRTFGSSFGPAEATFTALVPERVQESDELYVLGSNTDAIVKIRAGLMDVKVLREVNADGLEQWAPTMKVGFPLPAAELTRVFEALGIAVADLDPNPYPLDRLLTDVFDPAGARVVRVRKHRQRYTVGGCMTELTDVTADGLTTRTIAIEAEDPVAVSTVLSSTGLGVYVNQSYARGLPTVLDGLPARFAVIDVGTNSVKFHIGERSADGTWRTVVDRAEVTRLGEGLEHGGPFADEALARTVDAIEGMVDEARRHDVSAVAAVGTAGFRMATNRSAAVDAIRHRTGVTVEVIHGERESELAYLATTAALGPKEGSVVVFDTGGGSTQFTFGHEGKVDERFSVDVGAVRYTERFGLDSTVTPSVLAGVRTAIAADLSRLDGRPSPDALVGMGGAITNLTAVKLGMRVYDPERVHGTVLDLAELDRQIDLYRSLDTPARRAVVGLQPARAEVILAGACIVRTILEKLGMSELTVSDRGLRHGVIAERFGA